MSDLNQAKELLREAVRGASYDGHLSYMTEEKISDAVDLIVEIAVERTLAKIEKEAEKFLTELNKKWDEAQATKNEV